MGAGRPSEYNEEICEQICNDVANGANLMDTLSANDAYPSWPTFRRWKSKHSELRTLYVNAIQDKSEPLLKEMDEIALELRTGEIDASTANVLIQTIKWKLSKFYPKMFGDSQKEPGATVNYNVNVDKDEIKGILDDFNNEL